MTKRQIILASGSPRRIEMMKEHGFEPIVMPSKADESLPLHRGMTETAMFLALKKAREVEQRWLVSQAADEQSSSEENFRTAEDESFRPPIIVAADTIVYYDGEIMGKPSDKEDAFRMLTALRKECHYVVTGVALVEAGAQNTRVFSDVTKVYFTDYTDKELLEYLDTEEAYDKAGAYAIQGYFSRYVDRIEGDYDNVVGFPWYRFEKELDRFK